MSKPFELNVYPLREKVGRNARPGYVVGKCAVSTAEAYRQGQRKRLTPAELAAEYWRSEADWRNAYRSAPMPGIDQWAANQFDARDRERTLHRFATLPHYDEHAK
jgi:hypothetical protein